MEETARHPSGTDSTIGFSYAAFETLVREFAESVPALLLQHRETADLAFAVERLGLVDSLRTRFTVAIIGQMRVCKSTLLNALIGRRLAPTGVSETTATVNWFRHGEGDRCERFRVHWNDGSSEDHPLEAVAQWLGQSDHATRTQALDFFADSPFLRVANIVDTPGTRSVLNTHEATVRGFLAERLEAETLHHGGRADAIIYVINPVARQDDRDLLALFEERTRPPGASALQQHRRDAEVGASGGWRRGAPGRATQMPAPAGATGRQGGRGHPRQRHARPAGCRAVAVWDQVARLATASHADVLDDLLLSDDYFCRDHPAAPLDSATRRALLERLSWPALRFCLQLAHQKQIDQGAALLQQVRDASGIDRLQQVLQARFFALSGLIKAGTVLRKAWQPCDQALLTLRDLTERRHSALQRADQAAALVQGLMGSTPALRLVLDYVTDSKSAVANEQQRVEATWNQLDRIRTRVEQGFRFLDADLAYLEQLEQLGSDELPDPAERAELRRLFGGNGSSIQQRLGLAPDTPLDAAIEDQVWDRRDAWATRRVQASRGLAPLCAHASDCLDRILEHLDHQTRH